MPDKLTLDSLAGRSQEDVRGALSRASYEDLTRIVADLVAKQPPPFNLEAPSWADQEKVVPEPVQIPSPSTAPEMKPPRWLKAGAPTEVSADWLREQGACESAALEFMEVFDVSPFSPVSITKANMEKATRSGLALFWLAPSLLTNRGYIEYAKVARQLAARDLNASHPSSTAFMEVYLQARPEADTPSVIADRVPNPVTLEWLRREGACGSGIDQLRQEFGGSIPITPESVERLRNSDANWFATTYLLKSAVHEYDRIHTEELRRPDGTYQPACCRKALAEVLWPHLKAVDSTWR